MVYARPWFFDAVNHATREPMVVDLAEYERLPKDVKPLLVRAVNRQRYAVAQPVSPAPGPEPDEHACPCGSGDPYRACHGARP
jgi:hypothetical protein